MPTSNFTHKYSRNSSGFVTLVSVLTIGAIGVAITTSTLLLGIGSSRTGFVYQQSNQAKALSNACIEDALQEIRDSTSFTGSGNLFLGQGTCSYTVTSQGGQNRTITASGEVGTVVRKARVVINKITPTIDTVSWQEVVDF